RTRCAASARPRPAGGHCPASDRTAQSARTASATAQPAPSRQEIPLGASSSRSAQIPRSPASTASSPNPMQQSTPPHIIPRSLQLAFAEVPLDCQGPPTASGKKGEPTCDRNEISGEPSRGQNAVSYAI